MRDNSATAVVAISTGSALCCLLTHRPMSVQPPSSRASGNDSRSTASDAAVRGTKQRAPCASV